MDQERAIQQNSLPKSCTNYASDMKGYIGESQKKKEKQILREQGRKKSSEFVKIPIRILKKEEYENTQCNTYSDNTDFITKNYAQQPKLYNENSEKDYSQNYGRTIPINIHSEVKKSHLENFLLSHNFREHQRTRGNIH